MTEIGALWVPAQQGRSPPSPVRSIAADGQPIRISWGWETDRLSEIRVRLGLAVGRAIGSLLEGDVALGRAMAA